MASKALPPFSRIRSAARVASAFIEATAKCCPRTTGRMVRLVGSCDSCSCPMVIPVKRRIISETATTLTVRMTHSFIFLESSFDHIGDLEKILRIEGGAESHLGRPRQSANHQHRSAFVRNDFAAAFDL